MIGIVLLTHGSLGLALLKTAEMILGKKDRVEILPVQSGSSLNDIAEILEEYIIKYRESGLLILTDMFGGSPTNIAMAYMNEDNVDVVTGVNLPMLIKALTLREENNDVTDIAKKIVERGKDSIKRPGDLLNG
ncbi:PTS system, fructose-specific enzyme II, A component [Deferribacter desulfuricans SSM1]|uniref:PTS system, fructose-specific enzyme II, A component n=1 Tax=Deferribacter desulfuricans (strain DSM 14783 / JCM 11476 / NBRC 101012 / SSM1) TaxID=639282 RepID=D3PD46_DEFDS|nr:PTS sugar transporter subunit IIA [Deferribacter desulfuricans]BAI80519.1 PTS system, fructose-specific enzyme II, A component [Deferribacter desulfuricans SSM1]